MLFSGIADFQDKNWKSPGAIESSSVFQQNILAGWSNAVVKLYLECSVLSFKITVHKVTYK